MLWPWLNPPPSLTERCKNGILILPKAKATQKYAHFNFKRSRPTDDTIFVPTRQGRSAPPTAVAGAATSALQSKNIRSLPINCPFYRKFLTEPINRALRLGAFNVPDLISASLIKIFELKIETAAVAGSI